MAGPLYTLKGSKHANSKALRFERQGEIWRVAFAFDLKRQAILLAGGDKGGADEKRFYTRLIATADRRFDGYLATLKATGGGRKPKERSRGKKS